MNMRGYFTLWTVIVDCIVLHYMHIWHLRIRASSLQFRASKINMALARMDKLVKKLMSNPGLWPFGDLQITTPAVWYDHFWVIPLSDIEYVIKEFVLTTSTFSMGITRYLSPKALKIVLRNMILCQKSFFKKGICVGGGIYLFLCKKYYLPIYIYFSKCCNTGSSGLTKDF